jgi:hypothetical protein
MGHAKHKHREKVRIQLVNKQENDLYYQEGSNQKNPRSESQIKKDRTLEPKP